jgi:hypothetical protein
VDGEASATPTTDTEADGEADIETDMAPDPYPDADGRDSHAEVEEGLLLEVRWPGIPGIDQLRAHTATTFAKKPTHLYAHRSVFPAKVMLSMRPEHTLPPKLRIFKRLIRRSLWSEGSQFEQSPDTVRYKYEDLLNEDKRGVELWMMLRQAQMKGLVVIEGVPTDTTSNEDCRLREVMNWIGEIRNTFYGETWNVKSMPNSKNIAYTSLNLGLHMDLL